MTQEAPSNSSLSAENEALRQELEALKAQLSQHAGQPHSTDLQEQALFNAVPAMAWLKDDANNIIKINDKALSHLGGLTRADVEGRHTREFYGELADQYLEDDLEVIRSGRPKLGIIEPIDDPTGMRRWFRTDKSPCLIPGTDKMGVLVFSQDITEQRAAQMSLASKNAQLETSNEELKKATLAKSEFLANMSHELRTPLNSVIVLSRLLNDGPQKVVDPKQHKFVEVIHQSGQDLLTLINDLLDLSKIEAGHMVLNHEEVNLRDISTIIEKEFKPQADERSIVFQVLHHGAEGKVITDVKRLKQIVKNLLSNAFKFTSEGGRVNLTITQGQAPYAITIEVTDTGIGIPHQKLEMIFESFKQVDGSISRDFGGTGLGLAIVKQLTDLLGGKVTVQSRENIGSSFMIQLPNGESVGEHTAQLETPAQKLGIDPSQIAPRTVLVANNDTDKANQLKGILKPHYPNILLAEHGKATMAILETLYRVDVLIIQMDEDTEDIKPYLSGIRSLKRHRSIPIIVTAPTLSQEDIFDYQNHGVDGCLSTPVDNCELLAMIERLSG